MATTWTIAIDWDRDGEFSGDDIVTERAVWVNWFLGFREPYKDIAQNSVAGPGPGQPRPPLFAGERGRGESAGGEDPAAAPGARDVQRWHDNAHALVGLGRVGASGC